MELFNPEKREGSNDPVMINLRGAEVQVPQERVPELLMKGFHLKDPFWQPNIKEEPVIKRDVPKSLEELKKETALRLDTLEVTQI